MTPDKNSLSDAARNILLNAQKLIVEIDHWVDGPPPKQIAECIGMIVYRAESIADVVKEKPKFKTGDRVTFSDSYKKTAHPLALTDRLGTIRVGSWGMVNVKWDGNKHFYYVNPSNLTLVEPQ